MTAGVPAPPHSIALENLQSYNGFYNRSNCRQVVYQLYAGLCQVSNEPVALEDAHVAHIAPRSHAQFFESLYPGVDVDNLVNLHLVHKQFNLRVSDYFVASPMAVHNAISYSARLIQQRLPRILRSLSSRSRRELDLEGLFDNLGTKCIYDIESVYGSAINRGSYHALPEDMLEQCLVRQHLCYFPDYDTERHVSLTSGIFKNYLRCAVLSPEEANQSTCHRSLEGQFYCPAGRDPAKDSDDGVNRPDWVRSADGDLAHPFQRLDILPVGDWVILPGGADSAARQIEKRYFSPQECEVIRVGQDFNLLVTFLSYANDDDLVIVPGTDHFSPCWDNGPFKSELKMPAAVLNDYGTLSGCGDLCDELMERFSKKQLKEIKGMILRRSEVRKSVQRCKKYFAQYPTRQAQISC